MLSSPVSQIMTKDVKKIEIKEYRVVIFYTEFCPVPTVVTITRPWNETFDGLKVNDK